MSNQKLREVKHLPKAEQPPMAKPEPEFFFLSNELVQSILLLSLKRNGAWTFKK